MLLAPPRTGILGTFNNVSVDCDLHEALLRQVQHLRGATYLRDGAIGRASLTEGIHQVSADRNSWHLVVLDEFGTVCGCVRYQEHPPNLGMKHLGIQGSSLAHCPKWGARLRVAVEEELQLANTLQISFVEIGGWALSDDVRGTTEALRMVLAVYAFSRELGGAVGLATATTRHGSASILRRIGGRSLTEGGDEVPPYQDPQYGCSMEVLRFYSWAPNPRYDFWIHEMKTEVQSLPIICVETPQSLASVPRRPVTDFVMPATTSASQAVWAKSVATLDPG